MADYKIIQGQPQVIESQINGLAQSGWEVFQMSAVSPLMIIVLMKHDPAKKQ